VNGSASRTAATVAIAAATILVLLGVGVALFFNPPFVAFEQGRANAAGWTGYNPPQLRSATDAILAQLYVGPGDFAVTVDGQTVLDERERSHMRDVRGVFDGFGLAVLVGAVVLIAGRWRSRGAPWFWRAIRGGATTLVVAVILLGAVAAVAFDALFEAFHEIFFAGGTFTFDPRTERLVQLFPDQFWQETSILLALALVVLGIAVRFGAGRRLRGAGAPFVAVGGTTGVSDAGEISKPLEAGR
jgi:integral membrane protein (TIGR01906 family)